MISGPRATGVDFGRSHSFWPSHGRTGPQPQNFLGGRPQDPRQKKSRIRGSGEPPQKITRIFWPHSKVVLKSAWARDPAKKLRPPKKL